MMGIKLDSNDFLNLTIHCLKKQEKMGQAGPSASFDIQLYIPRFSSASSGLRDLQLGAGHEAAVYNVDGGIDLVLE
jgi:hypothetical protein